MKSSKYLLITGMGVLFITACSPSPYKASTSLQSTTVKETKTEKPVTNAPPTESSKPADSKAAGDYWTKEKMDKAKPPEMGVVVDPNTPQSTDKQDSATPQEGFSPGCADAKTGDCKK